MIIIKVTNFKYSDIPSQRILGAWLHTRKESSTNFEQTKIKFRCNLSIFQYIG